MRMFLYNKGDLFRVAFIVLSRLGSLFFGEDKGGTWLDRNLATFNLTHSLCDKIAVAGYHKPFASGNFDGLARWSR